MQEQGKETLSAMIGTPPPWILGIVNVTPDSFSGDGMLAPDKAVTHARELKAQGADILDIGAESTAPGSPAISAEEELQRLKPLLQVLPAEGIVSVDTYKAKTAEAALRLGARIVNDVSGMRADPDMPAVIREHRAFIVIMHSKQPPGRPHAERTLTEYEDIVETVSAFFEERIDFALKHGVSAKHIILDPGMGAFLSGDPAASWQLLAGLEALVQRFSDFPLLLGISRKGFLGGKMKDRDGVSQLLALDAALKGVRLIRTHNPGMAAQFFDAWRKVRPSP